MAAEPFAEKDYRLSRPPGIPGYRTHRWQRIFRGCIHLSVLTRASAADHAQQPQPIETGNLRSWPQIEDYGIIGDCRSAALVSREGSIEWLCWPRFDSASIFAALLDRERGGYWRISPVGPNTIQRQYVRDSNVLETRFLGPAGSAILTDAMTNPYAGFHDEFLPDHEVIRHVECASGEIELEIDLWPRANFGETKVQIRQLGELGLCFTVGKGAYWLRSSLPLSIANDRAKARVILRSRDILRFSFSYSGEAPAVLRPLEKSLDACIDHSITAWQQWARRANYDGAYRDAVLRSALTLKLLTFLPSGAIIAAPTTSLPEKLGAGLNWDYRYCWLRDSSMTIRALLELDYWEEAEDFLEWLLQATRLTQPSLKIAYTVYGGKIPAERALRSLTGYKHSVPVHIGNAARDQLQLDVYGEVIDAAAQFAFHGGHLDREMQKVLIGFGNYVVDNWNRPDEGIWEPRSGRQNHTHSRLLCWTAMDRLVRLSKRGILQGAPLERYQENGTAIRRQIEQRAWNDRMQSYVSILDGEQLDASLLLLSWYGFDEAGSERMRGTHRAIRQQLGTPDSLLYRYKRDDPEGAFALCSFWEAEYLALGGGSLREAQQLFTHLMRYANHLGLYGEEIDPDNGMALGNFPQAFTHVGLIGAALSIRQREKGEQQLAHRPPSATDQPRTEVQS
jgi:GH15 family glucan-1,4-alpha-glucosidase